MWQQRGPAQMQAFQNDGGGQRGGFEGWRGETWKGFSSKGILHRYSHSGLSRISMQGRRRCMQGVGRTIRRL